MILRGGFCVVALYFLRLGVISLVLMWRKQVGFGRQFPLLDGNKFLDVVSNWCVHRS